MPTKNKGEWSEPYIFFRLLADGRVYVADHNMDRLADTFLDIVSVIREEDAGKQYRYYPGDDNIRIELNGELVKAIPKRELIEKMRHLWQQIKDNKGNFDDAETRAFLASMFVRKIASPPIRQTDYFGGTEDIVLQTIDYRSGVNQTLGFSAKSDIDAPSTLFNASGDNTNFIYELLGCDDNIMDDFNALYNIRQKVNRATGRTEPRAEVASKQRLQLLRDRHVTLRFAGTANAITRENLVRCGGVEMPTIVAGLLEHYYYEHLGSSSVTLHDATRWLADNDYVKYKFDDLYSTYRTKIVNLLYAMFTGLRFGQRWSGRSDVNGGYIVVRRDGDVVAVHSCIADSFKDFLFDKLGLESPSCTRHRYMRIYKEDGHYYLKLALQLRFKLKV